jgi:hypothetical protein
MLSEIWRDEHRTSIPSYSETPSESLDAACDEWCRATLAHELIEAPLPPPELRSWMLARAIYASSTALCLEEQREPSPGPLTWSIVEQFLIEEWHGAGRVRWALLMLDRESE